MPEAGLADGRASATDPALIEDLRHANRRVDLDGDDTYYLTCRSLKDRVLRVKGEVCHQCCLEDACAGVWEPYVRCHGWEGFVPVERPRAPGSAD